MRVTRTCAGQGRRFAVGAAVLRRGVITSLAAFAVLLLAAANASAFSVSGSVEQVDVTGLPANAEASLSNARGETVATQTADSLGGLLYRKVKPDVNYRVHLISTGETSEPVTVHTAAAAPWDPAVYNQSIADEGYTYLTTRDGTQLAIDVHPPTHPAGQGVPSFPGAFTFPEFPANANYTPPYPTLIEYSGYGYANPKGPESGIAVLANLMGFAVVDVNMRGTGCSGGAFDFFEPLQNLDGYDVIETIAKQPWVLHNKVGMLGISYGGISQLFTAQLQPPELAAIAPVSVIDATATTLYPGGVVNDGFAVAWAEQRQQNAEPATGPGHGQEWANTRIGEGDATCKANQVLHGEAANLLQKIKENSLYHPEVADPLDPVTFVHNIDVPTFMACQFEDEQTGGHCANLVKHFTGTSRKWFTFTNGAHIDSLDPYTYTRLYDFYELYVAHKAPIEQAAPVQAAAPVVYEKAMGLPPGDIVTLPPDPIEALPTYELALSQFEKIPSVRVLFDNGAGEAPPGGTTAAGNPYPGFEETFSELPVPGTTARTWYLGPHGTLTDAPPANAGVDSYTSNANATPPTDYGANTGTGGLWSNASKWEWNWVHSPAGSAASYVSSPLTANAVAVGAGAIHLWVKSSTPDVDIQATVSEVGPEGNETFVQDGWLRASERKLATTSENIFKQEPTLLEPIPSFTTEQSMPANKFVPVVIPLYYEGHVYRAGSRVKVTIAAPNGTQPIWSSSHTRPEGTTATVSITFSPTKPASLILPVVPGVSVPTGRPACPSLRNEPCRPYVEYVNNGS